MAEGINRCGWCGVVVERRDARGPAPKYCNKSCYAKAYRRSTGLVADNDAACLACSAPLVGRQANARVCSHRCQAWLSRNPGKPHPSSRPRLCAQCGTNIDNRDSRSSYCSSLCRDRRWASAGVGDPGTCERCGTCFVKRKRNSRTCSSECSRLLDLTLNYEGYLRRGQERRARERGARTEERFTRLEIFERDGWICHLCGLPTDPSKSMRHPLMPSIDHIVPLKLGGQHTKDNVRCAHFGCNAAKGARSGWSRARSQGDSLPETGCRAA